MRPVRSTTCAISYQQEHHEGGRAPYYEITFLGRLEPCSSCTLPDAGLLPVTRNPTRYRTQHFKHTKRFACWRENAQQYLAPACASTLSACFAAQPQAFKFQWDAPRTHQAVPRKRAGTPLSKVVIKTRMLTSPFSWRNAENLGAQALYYGDRRQGKTILPACPARLQNGCWD